MNCRRREAHCRKSRADIINCRGPTTYCDGSCPCDSAVPVAVICERTDSDMKLKINKKVSGEHVRFQPTVTVRFPFHGATGRIPFTCPPRPLLVAVLGSVADSIAAPRPRPSAQKQRTIPIPAPNCGSGHSSNTDFSSGNTETETMAQRSLPGHPSDPKHPGKWWVKRIVIRNE